MKLLFVIHQYFPDCHSGTEQYCLAVSREMRRRGDEVVVLSYDTTFRADDPLLYVREDSYDGFAVLRLGHRDALQPNDVLRDYHGPLVAARFRRVLRQVRPDAVHFFHLRRLGSDLLDVARDAGVRSVVHLMDFWYLCPRFTLLRADGSLCEGPPDGGTGCVACFCPELRGAFTDPDTEAVARRLALGARPPPGGAGPAARFAALIRRKDVQLERLARADAVVAPSRFLARMFEQNGFCSAAMQVVPYGLEPDRVRRIPVDRPRVPLRVAFAGVLSPWKAPHVAVEAVLQVDGPIELQVHGRTDEPMFQAYIDGVRARAAGDARIRFPGAFGAGELDSVLADTDLLVVPSVWYENTPFVILEAFAAGVPVAAADLGGMREIVEPGVNGFLFEPGDPEALAEVLRSVLARPELLRALEPLPPPALGASCDVFRRLYAGS